jgi:hypothetical protein
MSHDLAAQMNAVRKEINATNAALKNETNEAVRRQLIAKLERLENRLDDLESDNDD